MNDEEIKGAVARFKKDKELCHCKDANLPLQCSRCDSNDVAINILERYLSASSEMPEKIIGDLEETRYPIDLYPIERQNFKYGFNTAIDLWTLAKLKQDERKEEEFKNRLDGLSEIIFNEMRYMTEDGEPRLHPIHLSEIDKLANAIREYLGE